VDFLSELATDNRHEAWLATERAATQREKMMIVESMNHYDGMISILERLIEEITTNKLTTPLRHI